MLAIVRRCRNPFMAGMLFLAAMVGTWVAQPVSSAAALCGVNTGSVHSTAGAIVESYYRDYETGALVEARGMLVRVWNVDTRPDADSEYGNILRLDQNNNPLLGQGVEDGLFGQYNSGCGDGHNVVLGEDASSARYLGGTTWQTGPWSLDCDATQYGVGNERVFSFTGVGVPDGARAGGTWNTFTTRTPNGFTTAVTLIYTEPSPPDNAPVGAIDNATCNLLQGWALDMDRPNESINVHVYIDGVAFAVRTDQFRGDVNASYGVSGNHGFRVDLSGRIPRDGRTHNIVVYAIGVSNTGAGPNNPVIGTATVGPCFDFTLVPSVSPSASTVVVGQPVTFSYFVNNSGTTGSRTVAVALKQYVVAPGQAFNSGIGMQDNVMQNCDTRYSSTLCATSWQLPSRQFPRGSTSVDTSGSSPAYTAINTSALTPGTRVCQMLAVDPASETSSGVIRGRWSAPVCVMIGKKPYVTIRNGDAWAGGSFRNTTNNTCPITSTRGFEGSTTAFTGGQAYGAYAEYGLTSLRGVTNFGSGGKPFTSGSGSSLTFRNTPLPLGEFSSATDHCLNDALAFYGTRNSDLTISGSAPIANWGSGLYVTNINDTGTVTINSGAPQITLAPGRHITLIVTGDVLINKNIEFAPGPYTNLADIPSLTVISRTGNIRVSQNVTRIDGFFQAQGKFITCHEGDRPGAIGENDAICRNPLTVNGAVTASEIVARRIHGGAVSGGVDRRNEAAEQFIMRPDLFLSRYMQSQSGNQLKTVDENELPPRY